MRRGCLELGGAQDRATRPSIRFESLRTEVFRPHPHRPPGADAHRGLRHRCHHLKGPFGAGSGNLMVPSTLCDDSACVRHQRFDASKSSTAVNLQSDGQEAGLKDQRDELTVTFGTGEPLKPKSP